MSQQRDHKFQVNRPNPHKPSVVKEYGFWWAKAYDQNNQLRMALADTHAAAFEQALSLIDAEAEQ